MWCDNCQDHFEIDHYDAAGCHLAGRDYGPEGQLIAQARLLRRYLDAYDAPATLSDEERDWDSGLRAARK